jgi:hypothetical protein
MGLPLIAQLIEQANRRHRFMACQRCPVAVVRVPARKSICRIWETFNNRTTAPQCLRCEVLWQAQQLKTTKKKKAYYELGEFDVFHFSSKQFRHSFNCKFYCLIN